MSDGFTRQAGEVLGDYRLVAPIGRGGFSEVWRAVRAASEPGREVAVKVLVHPEHVAQLRAEAKALTIARGPGIVAIHEVHLDADPPHIVLELAAGDLRNLLRRHGGRLEPTSAIGTFELLLDVLARVHREGIVHGDLKPENVLAVNGGWVVADFGLSRRLSQRSASLSVSLSREDVRLAGTLDYMAPEQRAGEKPTTRSDVFAAGVILYEMLTGERPQGVFKLPSERDARIPPVVDRAIACSLADDPRHRFASAGAMVAFLRSGLNTDWKELAKAHKRTYAILAGLKSEDASFLLCLHVLALVGDGVVLFVPLVTAGGEVDFTGSEHRVVLCLLFAAAIALLAGTLFALRPFLRRREARILELRRKIEQQIQAAPQWRQRTQRRPRVS